ncbi:MAG: type 1 glutamine amidotransferase [Rhizobiaceae bacterium]
MRLMIVEGNPEEILARNELHKMKSAWQSYGESLRLHASDAQIDVGYPYAAARDQDRDDPSAYDGFVLTGSAVSWGAEAPEARPYLDYIEPLLASGKPVLGSCWGMQTVSVLLGGMSGINPNGSEIGLARGIRLTDAGRKHRLFEGMAQQFSSPTWHRDHVTRMPAGAVLLAESDVSPVQALAYQTNGVDYLGYQFHPECELAVFKAHHERAKQSGVVMPGLVREMIDFPDNPPVEVSDAMERTRTIGNWIGHMRSTMQAREAAQ